MRYAIIGLGLAALVVGCDGVHYNPSEPSAAQTPSSSINLTCKADGGVDALTVNGYTDPHSLIPDWAVKACGPIRKATYPPSSSATGTITAANDDAPPTLVCPGNYAHGQCKANEGGWLCSCTTPDSGLMCGDGQGRTVPCSVMGNPPGNHGNFVN